MEQDLAMLVNLSVMLPVALVLGYITQRLGLSPILGYLSAGVVLGPQTPGVVADQHTAAQFAEIGVILLMFGVGLHFKLGDLLAVRQVAVPGALGQILIATALGTFAIVAFGGHWSVGLVLGLAISIASTVVLVRLLTDHGLLHHEQGRIAVGWLIVEDLFTVFILVILPALASVLDGGGGIRGVLWSVVLATVKIAGLGLLVLWGGRKLIPWILRQVARTRTRELFTLTVLAVALAIATGSALAFGVSMALGAFLAGMVVGQSEVSHQAAADALPMRDAFAVLFFVSVGMLFDPAIVLENPGLFLILLAIILAAKPISAFVIMWSLGYSVPAALTVAVALAQIGEFSFILADLAVGLDLIPARVLSLLVACALVSIAANPLLFRGIRPIERSLRRTRLWSALSGRSEKRIRMPNPQLDLESQENTRAVIVGYGPVGKTAAQILQEFGVKPVIVDLNVDTVRRLTEAGTAAVYGDATRTDILEAAGIGTAKYLLITLPEIEARTVIIIAAREINPSLRVFVRARYLQERAWLEEIGATEVSYEEAEAAIGLASLILAEVGASEQRVRQELQAIRGELALRASPGRRERPSDHTERAEHAADAERAADTERAAGEEAS